MKTPPALPSPAEQARRRAVDLGQQGLLADALAALDRAEALARDPAGATPPGVLHHIRANRGLMLRKMERPREALAVLGPLLEARPEPKIAILAHYESAVCYYDEGRLEEAMLHSSEVMALTSDESDPDGHVRTALCNMVALIAAATSDWTRADVCLQEAEAFFSRRGDTSALTVMAINRGDFARRRGDAAAAERHYLHAAGLAKTCGARDREAQVRLNLADLLEARADLPGALEHARRGGEVAAAGGVSLMQIRAEETLGRLEERSGRPDAARVHFARAEAVRRQKPTA